MEGCPATMICTTRSLGRRLEESLHHICRRCAQTRHVKREPPTLCHFFCCHLLLLVCGLAEKSADVFPPRVVFVTFATIYAQWHGAQLQQARNICAALPMFRDEDVFFLVAIRPPRLGRAARSVSGLVVICLGVVLLFGLSKRRRVVSFSSGVILVVGLLRGEYSEFLLLSSRVEKDSFCSRLQCSRVVVVFEPFSSFWIVVQEDVFLETARVLTGWDFVFDVVHVRVRSSMEQIYVVSG
mmetsp:Transcript_10238/g.19651  ORF Transcript_10238/g.19651 Transcript_10238/m.19651 type:complete len:240 (-) Transcript_10238:58-777(-)